MSVCPTCGKSESNGAKILFWCLGLFFAGSVGLFMLLLVCLTAVSVIGESANVEFQQISEELAETQTSQAPPPETFLSPPEKSVGRPQRRTIDSEPSKSQFSKVRFKT